MGKNAQFWNNIERNSVHFSEKLTCYKKYVCSPNPSGWVCWTNKLFKHNVHLPNISLLAFLSFVSCLVSVSFSLSLYLPLLCWFWSDVGCLCRVCRRGDWTECEGAGEETEEGHGGPWFRHNHQPGGVRWRISRLELHDRLWKSIQMGLMPNSSRWVWHFSMLMCRCSEEGNSKIKPVSCWKRSTIYVFNRLHMFSSAIKDKHGFSSVEGGLEKKTFFGIVHWLQQNQYSDWDLCKIYSCFSLQKKEKNSKKEKDFWGYPDPNSAASSLTPFLTQEMLNHIEKQTWPNLQLVDGLLEGRG